MTGPGGGAACAHWIGAEQRHCGEVDGVRMFIGGLACPAHTPSALASRPEPGTPAAAQQQEAS